METQLPEVMNYLNYRDFLKDFYNSKKGLNKDYSYRVFTNRAGVGSPSHLKMIIDGERNLTDKTVPKYLKAIGFTRKKDMQYFDLLVKYNQSKDHEQKIQYFEGLMAEKKKKGLTPLGLHQFSFLSQWYYVAIYVMIDMAGFKNDLDWIASRLRKKVAPRQIEQALSDLLALGLIKKVGSSYVQVDGALTVPDELHSMAIPKYHDSMINLSLQALVELDPSEREFNGVTFSFKKNDLEKIKEKIRAFRKEMNELTSSEDGADEVYQMNIQLFPLTKELI